MWGALVLLGVALPSSAPPLDARLRASLGLEVDTNARRAVAGDAAAVVGRSTEVVADGLGRLVVDGQGRLGLGRDHRVSLGLAVGAKRFWTESTEDLVAQSAWLRSSHRLGAAWVLATGLQGKISRIRVGDRDYELGSGRLALTWGAGAFNVTAEGTLLGFGFGPEPSYDHVGPGVSLGAGWRPWPEVRLAGSFGRAWRFYEGNGLVVAEPLAGSGAEPTLTFCDDPAALAEAGLGCRSRRREDAEWQLEARIRYRGAILLEAGYLLRVQRSTSPVEDVDRHRVTVTGVIPLPFQIDLGLVGSLQINDGTAVSDVLGLAEADESQNALAVKLTWPLAPPLDLELGWSLYASEFGRPDDVSFLRQTATLGLAVQVETRGSR